MHFSIIYALSAVLSIIASSWLLSRLSPPLYIISTPANKVTDSIAVLVLSECFISLARCEGDLASGKKESFTCAPHALINCA